MVGKTGGVRNLIREPAAMSSKTTIYVAIELSASSWLVAARLPGIQKVRVYRLESGDTMGLLKLIADLRSQVATKLGVTADLACCFEAGRDGFWLHRLLTANGITAYVLEPTSILVNRRARRAKTDRLDAEGMLRVLANWLDGDRQVCSMVAVPTPEEEDAKRPHREREHLVQDKQRIENRIEGCWLRKASGEDHLCALGRAMWQNCKRVTGGLYSQGCWLNSIVCGGGLFSSSS
jgi:transposase